MTTAKKSASKSPAKKASAKKASPKKSASSANHCWPGFQPVAGKQAGTKGSCEKKVHQTPAEKKADSRAAAASKREKGGN